MIKHFILASILWCTSWNELNAQTSIYEVFDNTTPITFLGIDFTNTRYIGRTGTVDTLEMIGLLNEMNDYIFAIRKDYNVADALKKDSVVYDYDLVRNLNKNINPYNLISNNTDLINRLNKDSISNIIKNYPIKENAAGIGMIYIVDNFFKRSEEVTVWLAFFDMQTKKVLLTERMIGIAEGFSFKLHWSKPFYLYLSDLKYGQFKSWKKKYLPKKK